MMYNINTSYMKTPTYLKELLRTDGYVHIAYDEKISNGETSPNNLKTTPNNSQTTLLDLTGSPLRTSLNCDDSIGSETIVDHSNMWDSEEGKHFPVDIKTARNIVNKYSRHSSPPLYCICDGEDKNKTVLLGVEFNENSFIRTIVNIHGCVLIDNILTIDLMVQKHLKNVGAIQDKKVYHKEISTYALYGQKIANFNQYDCLEFNGSVLMEVIWKRCLQDIKYDKPYVQLEFKVLIGHESSSAYATLWKDLYFLNSIILMFDGYISNKNVSVSDGHIESNNFLDYEDICSKIGDVLDEEVTKKVKLQGRTTEFNFMQVRIESLEDKLWNLFKGCGRLLDLKNLFHYLFEEMVLRNLKNICLEDTTSVVGCILKRLADEHMAVPTLTCIQSLQLLIELGLQKLKKDYTNTIKLFHVFAKHNLSNWDNSSQANFLSTYSGNVHKLWLPLEETVSFANRKLNYLCRLHIVTEFLLFTKNCGNLSENIVHLLAEEAFNRFVVSNSSVVDFESFKNNKLYEISVSIDYDEDILNSLNSPVSTLVEMSSNYKTSEVTTIFHKSKYPIFPPCIYNKYENLGAEGMYVTELIQYNDSI